MQKLGLGTVQFGLPYGVSNQRGQPSNEEVGQILEVANSKGVRWLDTAAEYGGSELVLGTLDLDGFSIATKSNHLELTQSTEELILDLKRSFERSLENLKKNQIDAYLVHRADELLSDHGDSLWASLEGLKSLGKVERIGVSIYSPDQVDELLQRYPIDVIQVPINVFDQRLLIGGQLRELKSRGVEIHARSIFLQGLLLMDQTPAFLSGHNQHLVKWKKQCSELGMTPMQAAFGFVKAIQELDVVLFGVNSASELEQCVDAYNAAAKHGFEYLATDNIDLIDPSRWRRNDD